MARKNGRNTKGRIVSAAWKLFYDQGYEQTTVEDIIAESGTSKGSFYHYFEGKDALLETLSMLFDEKYEEIQGEIAIEEMDAADALAFLNRELFTMIDNRIPLELLARLLSSQLVTHGDKHLLDRNRTYFRLLHRIVRRGQERGELRSEMTANEIVKGYAMFERALMYDWCLCGGEYALGKYAADMMPTFLEGYRAKK
ncbi:MAG: TetR/AcrR family transcriptional regulator [Clostridia bacterium]|nr:TetR/AcrR family transcriptional regulator [Clostridia bacterium]